MPVFSELENKALCVLLYYPVNQVIEAAQEMVSLQVIMAHGAVATDLNDNFNLIAKYTLFMVYLYYFINIFLLLVQINKYF